MAKKIFMVRHGEAESNTGNFFGGWMDVPLTALGRRQAALLRKRLAHEGIGRAYCSDLLRARQTLGAIGIDCPVEYSKELREKSYGELEGVCWTGEEKKYEKYHSDAYARAPGGENSADVQRRTVSFIKKRVMNAKEDKVLLVSHHGPIVLFAADALGMPISNWRKLRLGNCGLCIFSKEGKSWRMTLWNSLSHYGLQSFRPLLSKEKK